MLQAQRETEEPGKRLPSASWLELTYPFSSNPVLQDQYRHFNTTL